MANDSLEPSRVRQLVGNEAISVEWGHLIQGFESQATESRRGGYWGATESFQIAE